MVWYDRPPAGMKRSAHQAALDAYSMMAAGDSCSYYNHLQSPAVKYMKHEPLTYYQYAEEPDRYQNNLVAGGGQAGQVPQAAMTSASLPNYTPSPYTSYSTAAAVAAAAAAAYGSLPADSCSLYNLGQHVAQPQTVALPQASASEPQAVSPARPAPVEESTNLTAPLTPPLSVSPVMGHVGGDPPAPPRSMAANTTEGNYRSSTASPCERADCDSTTQLLAEGEMIPKLPLHVLSDLSEGLPLPATSDESSTNFIPAAASITQGKHHYLAPPTSLPILRPFITTCFPSSGTWKHILNSY